MSERPSGSQRLAISLLLSLFMLACAGKGSPNAPNPAAAAGPNAGNEPTAGPSASGEGANVKAAQAYALKLINEDRAAAKLPPVAWDETAARAAKRHVLDLARHGFTAHWGSDGSVPEQRYTEAGGLHIVTENAACFADAKPRKLRPEGPFLKKEIARFHRAFMDEKPPQDGHRQNILHPLHTKVGVAFVGALGTDTVCVVQEFIDEFGSYKPLPKKLARGGKLVVAGELAASERYFFGGIGLARIDLPKPKTPEELLKTGSYAMPHPHVSYFPEGFKTPKPVKLKGRKFELLVPSRQLLKPGLYEVSIFAKEKGQTLLFPVSLRTVRVE